VFHGNAPILKVFGFGIVTFCDVSAKETSTFQDSAANSTSQATQLLRKRVLRQPVRATQSFPFHE
jgi:hypothetical protein